MSFVTYICFNNLLCPCWMKVRNLTDPKMLNYSVHQSSMYYKNGLSGSLSEQPSLYPLFTSITKQIRKNICLRTGFPNTFPTFHWTISLLLCLLFGMLKQTEKCFISTTTKTLFFGEINFWTTYTVVCACESLSRRKYFNRKKLLH